MIQTYSLIFALMPILNGYYIGTGKFSLAEVILIVTLPIAMVTLLMGKNIKIGFSGVKNQICIQPLLFFLTILVITLISTIFLNSNQYSIIDIAFRILRLLLWSLSITILGRAFFNYNFVKKWIVRISIVAVWFITFQTIVWYSAGYYLPSLIDIPFLSMNYDYDYATNICFFTDFYFRPSSFFSEPAYFAYYVILGLVFTLIPEKKQNIFESKGNKKEYILPVFFTIGIILSTSTGGIYIAFFVWMTYILFMPKFHRSIRRVPKVVTFLKVLIVIMGIGLIIYLVSGYFTTHLQNRSIIELILNKPAYSFSSDIRLGGSYSLFNQLEGIQRVLGVGFGNEDIYLMLETKFLNSITMFMLSAGYLGLFVFITFSIDLIRISRKTAITFFISTTYFILCFTESMAYSTTSIVYLTIIYYMPRIENVKVLA